MNLERRDFVKAKVGCFTINLAQLCLHAGHPLHRVEEHVGVELETEGELVIAVHVHDARRVPRAAQAHLQ